MGEVLDLAIGDHGPGVAQRLRRGAREVYGKHPVECAVCDVDAPACGLLIDQDMLITGK